MRRIKTTGMRVLRVVTGYGMKDRKCSKNVTEKLRVMDVNTIKCYEQKILRLFKEYLKSSSKLVYQHKQIFRRRQERSTERWMKSFNFCNWNKPRT